MVWGRYRTRLWVLPVLSGTSAMALGWSIHGGGIRAVLGSALILFLSGVAFFLRLNHTNREVLFFFKALKNEDHSLRFTGRRGSRIVEALHGEMESLNRHFQHLREEGDRQERHFASILEHLSHGLLVISPTGHVDHVNREALRLLDMENLTHIRALKPAFPGMYNNIEALLHGTTPTGFALAGPEGKRERSLGLRATSLHLNREHLRVISIQDLSGELQQKEMDDWIRLIRVLSHEIMNSLAPIASLAETLDEMWQDRSLEASRDERVEKTRKGLETIAEQSKGLQGFFESYRLLSRIPKPIRKEFRVADMFGRLQTLLLHDPVCESLSLEFACRPESLVLCADESMISQALLNLIRNAADAVSDAGDPRISVEAGKDPDGGVRLSVRDNGHGIDPELGEEIFMPFFTTREKGSGVGLSYSRQAVALNGGILRYVSRPGDTRFFLLLPKTNRDGA